MKKYKTISLYLASFLYSKSEINFVGIDRTNPDRASFIFEPADKVRKFADDFFAGKALVNPLVLFERYQTLKNLIFDTGKNV